MPVFPPAVCWVESCSRIKTGTFPHSFLPTGQQQQQVCPAESAVKRAEISLWEYIFYGEKRIVNGTYK